MSQQRSFSPVETVASHYPCLRAPIGRLRPVTPPPRRRDQVVPPRPTKSGEPWSMESVQAVMREDASGRVVFEVLEDEGWRQVGGEMMDEF